MEDDYIELTIWGYAPEPRIVKAVTVGGEYGIRAYWIEEQTLHEAYGDDGLWVYNSSYNVRWLPNIIKALEKLTIIE